LSGIRPQHVFKPEIKVSFSIAEQHPETLAGELDIDRARNRMDDARMADAVPNMSSSMPSDPSPWHQFRFAVDIKSVRNFQLKSSKVYFMYTYDPLGTTSPILTYPAKDVIWPESEVLIPNSFCAFEFVVDPQRINGYLAEFPLHLELWQKDSYEQDMQLGVVDIDVSPLLKTRPTKTASNDGKTTIVRTYDAYYRMMWTRQARETYAQEFEKHRYDVGEVRVILAIEDFGAIEGGDPDDNSSVDFANEHHDYGFTEGHLANKDENVEQADTEKPAATRAPEPPQSIEANADNLAQDELDLWKLDEQRRFRARLAMLEQDMMKTVVKAWCTKDEQAEASAQLRAQELIVLIDNLNTFASDFDKRSVELQQLETKLCITTEEQHMLQEQRLASVSGASLRLKEELDRQLQREKEGRKTREKAVHAHQKSNDELREKIAQLEKSLQEEMQPENELNSVVETLVQDRDARISELKQLRSRLEEMQGKRAQYRTSLSKTLAATNKLKEEQLQQLSTHVETERSKLEQSAEKVWLTEAARSLKTDREALKALKMEVEALQQNMVQTSKEEESRTQTSSPAYDWPEDEEEDLSDPNDSPTMMHTVQRPPFFPAAGQRKETTPKSRNLFRLIQERDALLVNGAYTAEDGLIQALNERIQKLLGSEHE
jgi:centrosomal protein CEP120